MGFVRATAANGDTVATHEQKTDPHPQYLTQQEGDARFRQLSTAITDAELPSTIARNSGVTAAINGHLNATDPHPLYLTQVEADARYQLKGGQLAVANLNLNVPSTANGVTSLDMANTFAALGYGTNFDYGKIKKISAIGSLGTSNVIRVPDGGIGLPGYYYGLCITNRSITVRTTNDSGSVLNMPIIIRVEYEP